MKQTTVCFAAVVPAILFFVGGGAASPAFASTLFSSAGVTAIVGNNTVVFDEFSTGTSFAAESELVGARQATAIASTAYRSNQISALALKDVAPSFESGFVDAGATSRWKDGLFFGNGSGTGLVTFVFSLNGTIEGENSVGFSFDFDSEDEFCCSDSIGEVFRGPTTVSGLEISLLAEHPYNGTQAGGGTPLFIEAELFGSATVGRFETGQRTTDFGNSAILTKVILHDGNTLESLSGTDYLLIIPEPSTLILGALAFVGFLARGHCRRRE